MSSKMLPKSFKFILNAASYITKNVKVNPYPYCTVYTELVLFWQPVLILVSV